MSRERGGRNDTALTWGVQKVFRKGPTFGNTDDGMSLGRFGYADDHSRAAHVRTDGVPKISFGHVYRDREVLRGKLFT